MTFDLGLFVKFMVVGIVGFVAGVLGQMGESVAVFGALSGGLWGFWSIRR
jgi:hypothetical protein